MNNSKKIVLKFNLPGFKRQDINVKLSKDSIAIKAVKKYRKEAQKKDYFHSEKSFQRFKYATTVPKINPKKTKIEFKNSILKIIAPKI